jgi:hypothetical protein
VLTFWDTAILLQVSPARIVYNVTQPGSSAGDAAGDGVAVALAVYGAGDVKGYVVLEQDAVSDAKSEANASSYPKGELSCIW